MTITHSITMLYSDKIRGKWLRTGRLSIMRKALIGQPAWIVTEGDPQDIHPTMVHVSGLITAQRADLVGREYTVYIASDDPDAPTVTIEVEATGPDMEITGNQATIITEA